jgi:hypothetical protein
MTFSGRCLMRRSLYSTIRERVSVTKADYRNPKAESRRPKEGRSSKSEMAARRWQDVWFGTTAPRSSDCSSHIYAVGASAREPQRRERRRENSKGESAQSNPHSAARLQVAKQGLSLRSSRLCGFMGLHSISWPRPRQQRADSFGVRILAFFRPSVFGLRISAALRCLRLASVCRILSACL